MRRHPLRRAPTARRLPLLGAVVAAVLAVAVASGCSSVPEQAPTGPGPAPSAGLTLDLGYYGQSVTGHLRMLNAARPVDDWLADPATPAEVKDRLALARRLRDYAVSELHLPDNASYRRYADLGRPAVVWNVVAAPPRSLTLKTWCFPVLGCVGYRGYFDAAEAEALGRQLRAAGWEVSVYGVPAYSTLGKLPDGWFSDPLLNTFLRGPEGELARLIFHELAHQVAYAADDTTFNESFATAVERIGSRRWMADHATPEARALDERVTTRRNDFRALTQRYRARFDALYRDTASLDAADVATRKAALIAELRAEVAALKTKRWDGFTGYDRWFDNVNNASLGVLAAYNGQVDAFEALFEREGRDFDRFYAEVRRLAALPKAERNAALQRLGPP